MLCQSDGKVRHDGSSAAQVQPKHPVDERGGLLAASELEAHELRRPLAKVVAYYRNHEEKRR
jgi:hypothetical protein